MARRRYPGSRAAIALVVSIAVLAPGTGAGSTGPGGGDRIVFASARSGHPSIWSVRAGGGGLARLTAPPIPARGCECRFGDFDSHPAWSADGRRIAFTRGARLYVMRADGTDVRVVPAPTGAEDFDPAWSASGRLGFIRQRPAVRGPGHVHEIVSVAASGHGARVLAPASRSAYSSFAWSPRGERLAYAVPYADPGAPFAVGLFIVPADGGRPRFVLHATGMGAIAWSPSGASVALAASVPGAEPFDPYRLFTIRLSDRRIVQLTDLPLSRTADGDPRWSPDGRLIAFTRTDPRRSAVYLVRPDGKRERLVANDAGGPTWASDGRRLAFVQGLSGEGRPLTLTVVSLPSGRVLTRQPLRYPRDADGLGSQAWRPGT